MSFYTSACFYRPSSAPRVSCTDLADFCQRFAALRISTFEWAQTVQVKYGSRIDRDNRLTYHLKQIGAGLFIPEDIDWDVDVEAGSFAEVQDTLTHGKGGVYRTYIGLGHANPDVQQSITRRNSPENEIDLYLCDWSLDVGPISVGDLVTEHQQVGWVALCISGPGYLFPWTCAELVSRLEALPDIQRAMDLCKATWPVENRLPNVKEIQARCDLGPLWPYEDLDRPWDWYWGVSETG
jgi:hypothetical protein